MHHDSQPFYTPGSNYGLLNQIRLLRKAGAVSLQVLMMTPSAGTKLYEPTFAGGQVFESVGRRKVQPHMYDGNYVVAARGKHLWRKQLNLMLGYLYFYNPLWMAMALLRRRSKITDKQAGMQFVGMLGLFCTIRRTSGWLLRLMFCRIQRLSQPPASAIPMRTVQNIPFADAQVLVQLHIPKAPVQPELQANH
jgi:hypothetical protein